MSPILIRPVREQIEHDRIIRVLHARLRSQYHVESNLGDDRQATLRIGQRTHYPDIVMTAIGAPRKVVGVVEVETGESVNHLEAMAQWAHFGKSKAAFYLYVPIAAVDIAKRLVEDYQVSVTELWSYAPVGDRVHFWLVQASGASATPAGTEFSVPVDGGHLAPRPGEAPGEAAPEEAAAPGEAAAEAAIAPSPAAEKAEKAERAEGAEKAAKPPKAEKPAGAVPAASAHAKAAARPQPKAEKPAAKPVARAAAKAAPRKPVRPAGPVKPPATPKPAKPPQAAKASKAARAAKAARPSRPVKKTVKAAKPSKPPVKAGAKKPAPRAGARVKAAAKKGTAKSSAGKKPAARHQNAPKKRR